MWNKITSFIFGTVAFLTANPIFAYALFGIIVFGIILFQIGSCREKREERKDQQNQVEILKDKGKIEVIENQRQETIENNEIKREISENANANFNAVINVDSSKRNANFSAVKRKWCADHPADSKCL